jgi:hypothetical protein
MSFVVHNVALEQYFVFRLRIVLPSLLILMQTLFLPEGQTVQAWETSDEAFPFPIPRKD